LVKADINAQSFSGSELSNFTRVSNLTQKLITLFPHFNLHFDPIILSILIRSMYNLVREAYTRLNDLEEIDWALLTQGIYLFCLINVFYNMCSRVIFARYIDFVFFSFYFFFM